MIAEETFPSDFDNFEDDSLEPKNVDTIETEYSGFSRNYTILTNSVDNLMEKSMMKNSDMSSRNEDLSSIGASFSSIESSFGKQRYAQLPPRE